MRVLIILHPTGNTGIELYYHMGGIDMTIKPLLDKVVLKLDDAEETTASGIVLSTAAQEKPQYANVVAVGPGGVVDGNEVKMVVSAGDQVLVGKYSGTKVKLD